jgi:hypothetical protein
MVRAVTLDDMVVGDRPTSIKIDVEGNERRVLDGAHRLLAADAVELIQLEWNHSSSEIGETRQPVAELLASHGFVLWQTQHNHEIRRFQPSCSPPYGRDVFAARGAADDFLADVAPLISRLAG